jgi:hypothetical protein
MCAWDQLRNEPEGWWADAVRRARHLPVRSSHSTNIDMKIELLRLNPQLREDMAERAAALVGGQLSSRGGGDGGGGGAGAGAEGSATVMTPRVEYVLLEEKLQRIQARADNYREKRISVLLAKQQIEHQEVGMCFSSGLVNEHAYEALRCPSGGSYSCCSRLMLLARTGRDAAGASDQDVQAAPQRAADGQGAGEGEAPNQRRAGGDAGRTAADHEERAEAASGESGRACRLAPRRAPHPAQVRPLG